MRTPTSGELGYWGQRNAGTQSPATCNEDQPRYNVTQFGYTLPGAIRCVRTPPSFSEVWDLKPRRRVRGKSPPPFGDSGARNAPLTRLQLPGKRDHGKPPLGLTRLVDLISTRVNGGKVESGCRFLGLPIPPFPGSQ